MILMLFLFGHRTIHSRLPESDNAIVSSAVSHPTESVVCDSNMFFHMYEFILL